MSTIAPPPATLDDLMRIDGKAELIAGRIVKFMPNGFAPSQAATQILIELVMYERQTGKGSAGGDCLGFALRPALRNGRQSFCPDTSYYIGPLPRNRMKFLEGPPTFAVEVHSENDYGSSAERAIAAKRADYFEAGTRVVWDVDPVAQTVTVFRDADPARAEVFAVGQVADAEPAVPGWRMAVDEIFR